MVCDVGKEQIVSVWDKSHEVVEHGNKIESLSLTIKRVNSEADQSGLGGIIFEN